MLYVAIGIFTLYTLICYILDKNIDKKLDEYDKKDIYSKYNRY